MLPPAEGGDGGATVDLPHANAGWWERVRAAWAEPVADAEALEGRLSQLHGSSVDIAALRQLAAFYPETEGTFFQTTLPCIIQLGLRLPELCEQPIPLLRQGAAGVVELPRALVASLLANMFLCNFEKQRTQDMPHSDFSSLLGGEQTADGSIARDSNVAKLRMFIHYFERFGADSSGPRGSIRIRRNVLEDPPNWIRSRKPLRALRVEQEGGINGAVGCLQTDFANQYIGGAVFGDGNVQEEICFSLCPENCVAMLLCPMMMDDLEAGGKSEAILLTGAEQFSESTGYGQSLRYAGDYEDPAPRHEDGSLKTCVAAIDALCQVGDEEAQFRDVYMQRELNKAMAGFMDIGDGTEASLADCPSVATGNWGSGVFGGFDMLKAVLQWMAASESGRDVVYFPYGREIGAQLPTLASAASEAGFVTVGWMYRALVKFRLRMASGTEPTELFSFLVSHIEADAAARRKEEAIRQRTWSHLVESSREFNLDIVPRLAFCRGSLVDLIVESGLHRYAEFISVQGSYLFVEGGLQRVPCSKGEVFKDKFIGMKEKRLLMKFMQTVLSYDPGTAQGSKVQTLASESGALHTNESEVLRQHAAGVRRPEAATAATTAAATAAAAELDEWLGRPFVDFLQHRQLTDRLVTFILYALAMQDINRASAGDGILTTEEGLGALRRYMGCLGRFADTHTAFISTMYGAGEIPQSFCRCCAVYGGVYVLRRTMHSLIVGENPPPEPEPEPAPEPEPEHDREKERDGKGYFHGIVCTAGQWLKGKYLLSSWEHISALRPSPGEETQTQVVARCICVTSASLVLGVGTMLAVVPPDALPSGNDCCIRLQQCDHNARVAPAGHYVVHLSCSAMVDKQGAGEAATRERLQGFLKEAARTLFSAGACTEVVDSAGDVHQGADTRPEPEQPHTKPTLIWCIFFSRTLSLGAGLEGLPRNVFVAGDEHWGDMDFDGATDQARRIFEQIFPGEAFVPPLPDPDAVQDEVALLLETQGSGVDFEDREVEVQFSAPRLGLMLASDKDGLLKVSGLVDGGAAQQSGEIRVGDILTTLAGESTSGMGVDEVVRRIGAAPRPLTLVFSTTARVDAAEPAAESA